MGGTDGRTDGRGKRGGGGARRMRGAPFTFTPPPSRRLLLRRGGGALARRCLAPLVTAPSSVQGKELTPSRIPLPHASRPPPRLPGKAAPRRRGDPFWPGGRSLESPQSARVQLALPALCPAREGSRAR